MKPIRVVVEDLPVILRLGGWHVLKSFLGCISYIMNESGLEELMQFVFAENIGVDKLMSGGAFYKALRAHLLIDAALVCHLIESVVDEADLECATCTTQLHVYPNLH